MNIDFDQSLGLPSRLRSLLDDAPGRSEPAAGRLSNRASGQAKLWRLTKLIILLLLKGIRQC